MHLPFFPSVAALLLVVLLALTPVLRVSCSQCADESVASLGVKADFLSFFTNTIVNEMYNPHSGTMDGSEWPDGGQALSMIGKRRLHNFAALVSTVISEDIPGDIIETGVWRGGASLLAAKVVELMCDQRVIHMADSFKGIPAAPADLKHYSGWLKDSSASRIAILNDNSIEKVQRDTALFGIDPKRVQFVPGWFNESLPALTKQHPHLRFSVMRLDGDTYYSTMDALEALYAQLSPGGFIIIDDFVDWRGCRTAVDEFRGRYVRAEVYVFVYVCEYAYVYACLYEYAYAYAYVYVYVQVYVQAQAQRKACT